MRRLAIFAAAALLTVMGRADAGLVLDFTGGLTRSPSSNQTLGWDFTLTQSQTVTALGIWDEDSNGLVENHQVGIWNFGGGAPLDQVLVTNASTPVASAAAGGQWLFQNLITPLALAPGRYVLGADYATGADTVRTRTNPPTMAPGFSFNQGRFTGAPGPGLDFPDFTFSTPGGHFGPNLLVADPVNAVPEPSTLTMAIGALGILGYARLRRKGRASATAA